jgi:hypothetical protein
MPPTKNRELSLLATAGVMAAFAIVDYHAPAALGPRGEWLGLTLLAICIAQVTLIAAWAVFAPGNIVVRLPWSLLFVLMMWYVLAFGQRRAHYRSEDTLLLGIVLFLGLTVLQVPLWIAKQVFRYRMLTPGEVPTPAGRGPVQFQLKHLLIGTFLLSVALSPIRLVLPKETVGSLMPDRQLTVLILATMEVNLVATLPCLWGGFVSAGKLWPLGVTWSVYSFVVTMIEFAVLCSVLGIPGDPDILWELGLMNFTQGAVVFAVMRIYRALGYRLQRMPRAE